MKKNNRNKKLTFSKKTRKKQRNIIELIVKKDIKIH